MIAADLKELLAVRLKTLYVRFYKSFNYDYLRKGDARATPDPWDLIGDDLFYPFVRVSLDRDITTVVGANESGKSQLLTAVQCLLTGDEIRRRDFCRYSKFFSVGQEMALPEFGGQFFALTEDDAAIVRSFAGLEAETEVNSFHLFRFGTRTVMYVQGGSGWIETPLAPKDVKKLALPTYFVINATIPLPDSVPLNYLVTGSADQSTSRKQFLSWTEKLRQHVDWFSSPDAVQKSTAQIAEAFAADPGAVADEHIVARLKLAEDLLLRVAGINRSAFEELRDAVKGSEGYANGIVDRMNQQLADALNFPKWWSQDSEFSLYLTLRDFDLVFTVRDRTGSDYAFSERSGGMSYFLSYFVQYLAHDSVSGQEILLMDEPDAYLSTQGQQDLLRIFDAFAAPTDPARQAVQVLYVTHSPFLIDKNHGERIRVLEKGDGEEGTRIVANAARNHFEPLRSAFGAFVAETTFISNCNLVLEGQADQVLIAGISSLMRRDHKRRESLDLNHLSLVPAGSAEHVPYMVYLARGRDVDTPAVVVLLDSDKAGDDAAAELAKGYRGRRLLAADLVLRIGDVLTSPASGAAGPLELEDLLSPEVAHAAACHFASEVFAPKDAEAFTSAMPVPDPNIGQKIFKTVESAAQSALPDNPLRLDKVGFARSVLHVLEHVVTASQRDQVLDNFESLFNQISRAQRQSMRENARERTTKTLSRLRRSFFKDHPHTASRREVTTLLEDIETQLFETSLEAETLRGALRLVRVDFNLDEDPLEPVDDFVALRDRIEGLVYEGVREVQAS